ncbi:11146_t:CDS:1 [Ambispora gerdemannii]|uniref:11146_t:CDS:1 n=1 Tax=Ambispora gerdemannii TaxID=144530 RepID=A0A9N9C5A9_9GLOM|nr:11146_t:CDS:1 [Ambispora gerdemannii]
MSDQLMVYHCLEILPFNAPNDPLTVQNIIVGQDTSQHQQENETQDRYRPSFPPQLIAEDLIGKGKQPPNAFLSYRKAVCMQIKAIDVKLHQSQVSKLASSLWSKEGKDVKEAYEDLASKAKKLWIMGHRMDTVKTYKVTDVKKARKTRCKTSPKKNKTRQQQFHVQQSIQGDTNSNATEDNAVFARISVDDNIYSNTNASPINAGMVYNPTFNDTICYSYADFLGELDLPSYFSKTDYQSCQSNELI